MMTLPSTYLGGKYAGMDRYEARKAMVADLDKMGLSSKGRSSFTTT